MDSILVHEAEEYTTRLLLHVKLQILDNHMDFIWVRTIHIGCIAILVRNASTDVWLSIYGTYSTAPRNAQKLTQTPLTAIRCDDISCPSIGAANRIRNWFSRPKIGSTVRPLYSRYSMNLRTRTVFVCFGTAPMCTCDSLSPCEWHCVASNCWCIPSMDVSWNC